MPRCNVYVTIDKFTAEVHAYKNEQGDSIMLSTNYPARMTLIQQMLDDGRCFRGFHEFTIPANGEYNLSVLLGENVTVLYSRVIVPNRPSLRYEVRTNAVFASRGSAITTVFPQNPKRIRQTTNLLRPATITTNGALSDVDIVPGQTGSTSHESGEYFSPDDPKILPENTELQVRFMNPNGSNCDVLLHYKWFEVGAQTWGI
jgi:hypothetical protein